MQSLWDRLALSCPKGRKELRQISPRRPRRLCGSSKLWAVAAAGLCASHRRHCICSADRLRRCADQEQLPAPAPVGRRLRSWCRRWCPSSRIATEKRFGSVYLSAPDHKALAMSSGRMGFTTAQRDEETAKTAAIAACQRATEEARLRSRCELYAVGNMVVSSRGRPPMPQQPWIVRDPSIERPFAVGGHSAGDRNTRAQSSESMRKSTQKSKALALSASGFYSSYTNESEHRGSCTQGFGTVRQQLRRCVHDHCARRHVRCSNSQDDEGRRIFQPDTINAIAPELRDDVARRLGNATSGWNAVAVGASGRVGSKLGAESEQAAIDGSMADCSRHDRECRIAVIGPFLVESLPAPRPLRHHPSIRQQLIRQDPVRRNLIRQGCPGANETSGACRGPRFGIPGLSASEHEDLAKNTRPRKGIRPGRRAGYALRWRTGEWPYAEVGRGEGVLERCQVAYMKALRLGRC